MRLLLVLAAAVLLASCGDDTTTTATTTDDASVYEVVLTVLESREHGPQLCPQLQESYPPQCSGPEVVGFSWDDVDGWERADGTTWGDFRLVGTWDGERLTLVEPPTVAGPEQRATVPPPDFGTPCPEPEGGWVVDPRTATVEAQEAAVTYARSRPGFAGVWIDQSINPASQQEPIDERAMNDPALSVLNLRFTGDLERHERELRARFGGPLCVSPAAAPLDELLAIQEELHRELQPLWSSVDEVAGTVDVGVFAPQPRLQAELDARYGPEVVRVFSTLQPVTR